MHLKMRVSLLADLHFFGCFPRCVARRPLRLSSHHFLEFWCAPVAGTPPTLLRAGASAAVRLLKPRPLVDCPIELYSVHAILRDGSAYDQRMGVAVLL